MYLADTKHLSYSVMKREKIDKGKAIEAAENYAERNGLSVKKLHKERRGCSIDSYFFTHPNGVQSNGLLNDLNSQDYVTLIVRSDYSVEETEHTRKYLAK